MTAKPLRHRATALLIGALVVTCAAFWADCLVGPMTPLAAGFQAEMEPWASEAELPGSDRQWSPLLWDGVAQFYPWRLLAARAMRDGELALWNPHQMCGYPFVGNGQSALFYPPNWLLALVDVTWGMGLLAWLHYALAAVLTALLCRALGLGHLPSAFAGIAFAFGGFMVTWTELPTLMNSAAWLPGALLGIALIFRRHRWGIAVLGASLAMTLLAGHFQIAAYVWMTAATYAFARVAWEAFRQKETHIFALSAAVGIGALLAAPQVLPALELAGNSTRGAGGPTEAGWQFHRQRALQPAELLLLADPDAFGSPVDGDHELTRFGIPYSEHAGFVGLSTLVLALAGLAFRRTRHYAFFGIIALLALSIAMGGPPARWMYFEVPKLGQAGGFTRVLSVFTFAAAMAGAFGLDAVWRWMASSRQNGSSRWFREDLFAVGMVLVLAGELLPWAHDFLPRTRREHVYPATPTIERLMESEGRVLAVTPRERWGMAATPEAVLPPNSATVYGYDSVAVYDSLFPRNYREFLTAAEGAEPAPAVNGNMLLPTRATGARQMLMGLSDVLARERPDETDEQMVEWASADGAVASYHVSPAAPRAFTLPTLEWTSMFLGQPKEAPMEALRSCDWRWLGNGQMIIELPPDDSNRSLVVTETFYPGWSAYVDGRPRRVHAVAGGAFCGLRTHDGDREVRLVFEPASLRVGCFLALGAIGLLSAAIGAGWRSGRVDRD
ncbi:MAG: hypothetical protein ACLFU7_00420 [Armatimonadota bacterium]